MARMRWKVPATFVVAALAVPMTAGSAYAETLPQGNTVWSQRDAGGYGVSQVYRRRGDRVTFYYHGSAGGGYCAKGRLRGDRFTGRDAQATGSGIERGRVTATLEIRGNRIRWVYSFGPGDWYRRQTSGNVGVIVSSSLDACRQLFA